MKFRLFGKDDTVALVGGATDEAMTRESYDITAADIELNSPALLKVKDGASGNIKVTLAGKQKTDIILAAADVNESNIHVIKVFKTGTTISPDNAFLLWE